MISQRRRILRPCAQLAAAFVVVAAGACASMWTGTKPWFDEHDAGRIALSKRAAADLGCDAGGLAFSCVGPRDGCASVAVNGCEQAATYEFMAGRWMMNNVSRSREP